MHRATMRPKYISNNTWKREIAKADIAENLAYHLQFIYLIILYDKFGLSFKQLCNWGEKVKKYREQWQDDDNEEVTSDSILAYCTKRNLGVVQFVKSIPMSQKLALSDIKRRGVLGADRNIESAFVSSLCLSIPALKETYKFSNDKIGEFFDWIAYYIDSYTRKQPKCKEMYCNDQIIIDIFREECGWDIVKGEKVNV